MDDTFAKDHAAGAHQQEIVGLLEQIEPHLYGHSRAIVLITLVRLMAVILGPVRPETREAQLHEIPIAIRNILT